MLVAAPLTLVYYAHHHGSGHLRHARRLASLGVAQVVVVGGRGADVELPPDVVPGDDHVQPSSSPFHWTPTTAQVRRRFSALQQVLDDVDPDLVMVDVSVEAATFCHLAGYPVLHRRMPGDRTDPPHELAYSLSERLFAYYPRELEQPEFAWANKTRWLGMPDDHPHLPDVAPEPGVVTVVSGAGGRGVDLAHLMRAARQTPHRQWHVLGPTGDIPALAGVDNLHLHGWVPNPLEWLQRAEVVVCGAGHNTIAAAAAARRPVVLAPEMRPHDEQLVFARQLHERLGVPLVEAWDDADWPGLLASTLDGRVLPDALLVSRKVFGRRVRELLEEVASPRQPLETGIGNQRVGQLLGGGLAQQLKVVVAPGDQPA